MKIREIGNITDLKKCLVKSLQNIWHSIQKALKVSKYISISISISISLSLSLYIYIYTHIYIYTYNVNMYYMSYMCWYKNKYINNYITIISIRANWIYEKAVRLVYTDEKTSPLMNYLLRITFSMLFIKLAKLEKFFHDF